MDSADAQITDEYMREMLGRSRGYAVAILRAGPHRHDDGADALVWEHGRRNFQLRAAGKLLALRVTDEPDLAGIAVLNATVEQAEQMLAEDPAMAAGVLTFELHACRGFPGDALWSA